MKKVVCVPENDYDLDESARERIRALCKEYGYETLFCTEEEAFRQVHDAEIIYGYSPELLKEAKELKWFQSTWAGVGAYLEEGLMREGAVLTNASGCFGVAIAEHMIAVLLMMMRRLPEITDSVKKGEWINDQLMDSIHGSRALVIGTGDIGTCFARRLRAFEPARVTGVNRSGVHKEGVFDETKTTDRLDSLLGDADIVAMSLPGTTETGNVLSKERIALMKEGAYLINVGRGQTIDEDALADALNEGKLKGAALDVFREEPLPASSALRHAKNILITPHCAGQMGAKVTRDLHVELFLDNLKRYMNKETLRNVIDPEKGY